jgi:putative nucleotidyltransferase with HDIG domain
MFLKAEDIVETKCPKCGQTLEFWPDEPVRKCRTCGHRLVNPENTLKCLEWCRYAAQCLDAIRGGDNSWIGPLRAELIERMKTAFGTDGQRIEHALAVLAIAEEAAQEGGADPMVVVPAAILHDIGLSVPEVSKNQSAHGREGRRVATGLLADLHIPGAIEREVLDLIEHHHDRKRMNAPNGSVLFDADLIVNLEQHPAEERMAILGREALTEAGKRIGRRAWGLNAAPGTEVKEAI